MPSANQASPFEPRRIAEASQTIQDRFDLDPTSTDARAILDAKRTLWKRQSFDQALGIALRRVAVGLGEILISEPGKALDRWPEMADLPLPATDHAQVLSNDRFRELDPLSHSKIAAAEEVVGAAAIDARMRVGRDPQAARVLFWAWSKNSPELDLALRRLAVVSRQPLTIILLPGEERLEGRALALLSGRLH